MPAPAAHEPEATAAARMLLADADVAADLAIGILPDAHPAVIAEAVRLHDESEPDHG